MKPINETYISPTLAWKVIEPLAPFSEDELKTIARALSNPSYLGYDNDSIWLNGDELNCLNWNKLPELVSFLQSAHKRQKDVYFEIEYLDEDARKLTFSAGRDPEKIIQGKIETLKRDMVYSREVDAKTTDKKIRKQSLEKEMEYCAIKFQNKELTVKEFTDTVAGIQNQLSRI